MTNLLEMVGASFLFVTSLMTLLWVGYLFRQNAGIVDIGWALGFVISVWSYFILGNGVLEKKIFITLLVSIWGLRLAWYLTNRYLHSDEDPRYTELRKNLGEQGSDFKFLFVFLFQGFLVSLLTIPFLIICLSHDQTWHLLEGIGLLVWGIGLWGESAADSQLAKFKADTENHDLICTEGLWRYSRHPNYFFEFIIWVGYFLIALPATGGWLAILSPMIILFLLLKVSGIPVAEAEALRTKGDAYRHYQETTSSFIPWFPRDKK